MKVMVMSLDGEGEAVDRVVKELEGSLRKGDILLSAPIPRNAVTKFFNFIVHVSMKTLRGITHSCIYLGEGYVLDIDHKIIRKGNEIEKITLKQFVINKLNSFGGVSIYVSHPKKYTRRQRNLVVELSNKEFVSNQGEYTHSYIDSIIVGYRFMFRKRKAYAEDLTPRKSWTCGHLVAYLLKKSGTQIGKRASYTFVPLHFAYSPYFRVKKKVMIK